MSNTCKPTDFVIEKYEGKDGLFLAHEEGHDECKLQYQIIDTEKYLTDLKSGENFPLRNFMLDDIIGLIGDDGIKVVKKIINILWIRTQFEENRNKGYATSLLCKFLDYYKDCKDVIIVLRAQAMVDDYPTEPTKEQYLEFFKDIEKFLIPFGFDNFNSLCGFEFSEPYIHLNPNNTAAKYTWNAIIDHYYENMEGINYARYGAKEDK